MVPSQTLTSIRWMHVLALTALLLVAPMASAAQGHAHLIEASPEQDETLVAMPDEVVLTFDEPVEPAGDALLLVAPDGTERALDVSSDRSPEELRADLDEPLEVGEHTLAWRIVAQDGHVQEGTYAFVVDAAGDRQPDGPQPDDPQPEGADASVTDAESDAEHEADDEQAEPADASADQAAQEPAAAGDTSSASWIAALVLLGVGGAVAAMLMVRGRRRRAGTVE